MEITDGIRTKKVQGALSIFVVFAVWVFIWPVSFSDSMFLQLWPSILWAIGIGLASTFRCWKGVLLTLLLAVLPILAGGLYFGMSHASDESFLLAGVIPWSDASMHFRQAAQMAVQGTTITGMNGRFLYPAYLSSLLNIVSFNLLGAQLLSGLFFAGAGADFSRAALFMASRSCSDLMRVLTKEALGDSGIFSKYSLYALMARSRFPKTSWQRAMLNCMLGNG